MAYIFITDDYISLKIILLSRADKELRNINNNCKVHKNIKHRNKDRQKNCLQTHFMKESNTMQVRLMLWAINQVYFRQLGP